MTFNPQWKEIQENLYCRQYAYDRPDFVSRAKVQELCTFALDARATKAHSRRSRGLYLHH